LELALRQQAVPADIMHAAVDAVMRGECGDVEIAALLTALAVKGETVEELVGAARALRGHCLRVRPNTLDLLDTCGTGGDRQHTFNISTAVAVVVAACGVPVAKHGNRGVSSSSGSADVLEQLGVRLELSPAAVARCIDEVGIGFCFARTLHSAMKHVAPVRAALGFRTIFNLLGPLTNPARAPRQLIGANSIHTARLLADAIHRLDTTRTLVVCGNNELDEVALWGETTVFDVNPGGVDGRIWTPASFGLPACRLADLQVRSPRESADTILAVLAGAPGAPRNIVLANAAAALMAAGRAAEATTGVSLAAEAIDSGGGRKKLDALVRWTAEVRE
jgi:anthranilate phosphoribosyltransferase